AALSVGAASGRERPRARAPRARLGAERSGAAPASPERVPPHAGDAGPRDELQAVRAEAARRAQAHTRTAPRDDRLTALCCIALTADSEYEIYFAFIIELVS